jgi:hypothetical protein
VCLLEETKLALQKGDRAIAVILDSLDLNLPATHVGLICAVLVWRLLVRSAVREAASLGVEVGIASSTMLAIGAR